MIGGLSKLPHDPRDIAVGAVFRLPKLSEIPDVFEVAPPLVIKDQGGTDYCSAFAGTAVSEDQEQIELCPFYQFHKTKLIEGNDAWGADLRSSAKSFTKFGSLAKGMSPYTIDDSREDIIKGTKLTLEHDKEARKHRKASFLKVEGPYDFFDNIRATLWKFRGDRRSVVIGLTWCYEWMDAPYGIINTVGTPAFGHAFKVYGADTFNGKLYLKAQLSNGTEIGDKGIFYISREIINTGKDYGAFMFADMPPEDARQTAESSYYHDDVWWLQLIKATFDFLKDAGRELWSFIRYMIRQ